MRKFSLVWVFVAFGVAAGVFPVANVASAQDHALFEGAIELGLSKNLDDPNRDRFGFGVGGALYGELRLRDWIGLQLGATATWLSKRQAVVDSNGDGILDQEASTYFVGMSSGLRFHWTPLVFGPDSRAFADDGWVDVHFLYGAQEGFRRPGLDAGIGYAFALNKTGSLRLGPFARVHWLSAPAADERGTEAPVWLHLGATFTFGGSRAKGSAGSLADRDGDGVPDSRDRCPDVEQGSHPDPRRPGCPVPDDDGDGIPNDRDLCPGVKPGSTPDKKRRGCPIVDRDHDSIPDAEDSCPNVAGVASREGGKNGCPDHIAVREVQLSIEENRVFFASDKAVILPRSSSALERIAKAIKEATWIDRVRIEGHTDGRDTEEYNLQLGRRRAESVRDALVERGVEKKRLVIRAVGELEPIDSNRTRRGRARNRRVEFHLVVENEMEAPR